MDDTRVERILRVVEDIPAGRVATYGDVGAVAGEHARLVGRTLATWGSNVPWWRVVNARGEIPGHMDTARPYWQGEGIQLGQDGWVALRLSRINRDALACLAAPHLAEIAGEI